MKFVMIAVVLAFCFLSHAEEYVSFERYFGGLTRPQRAKESMKQMGLLGAYCSTGIVATLGSGAWHSLPMTGLMFEHQYWSQPDVKATQVAGGFLSFLSDLYLKLPPHHKKTFDLTHASFTGTRNVMINNLTGESSECKQAYRNLTTIWHYPDRHPAFSKRSPAINNEDRSVVRDRGEAGRILERRNRATRQ